MKIHKNKNKSKNHSGSRKKGNYYDLPLQIKPNDKSKDLSQVITNLQNKNNALSSELSSFREKFIDAAELTDKGNSKSRKEKNQSKSSNRSFNIAPLAGHEKKKSFDSINFIKQNYTSKNKDNSKSINMNERPLSNISLTKENSNTSWSNNFNYLKDANNYIIGISGQKEKYNEKSEEKSYNYNLYNNQSIKVEAFINKPHNTINNCSINRNGSEANSREKKPQSNNSSNNINNSNKVSSDKLEKKQNNYLKLNENSGNLFNKKTNDSAAVKNYIPEDGKESNRIRANNRSSLESAATQNSNNIKKSFSNELDEYRAYFADDIYKDPNKNPNQKNFDSHKKSETTINYLDNINSLSKNNSTNVNSFNNNNNKNTSKSPLKTLQDKLGEKDKEISDLQQRLNNINYNYSLSEKKLKKSDRKIDSLQNLIDEILNKSKNDQKIIEILKDEIKEMKKIYSAEVMSPQEKNLHNLSDNQSKEILLNLKTDEIVIHKIYTNYSENKIENVEKNLLYFVLISDGKQENFIWIDITNAFLKNLQSGGKIINKPPFESNNSKAIKNSSLKEDEKIKTNNNNHEFLIDAINYFSDFTNEIRNSITDLKTINNSTGINNEIKTKNLIWENLKDEKYKNFKAANLPLQNLYNVENEIISLYSEYLNFEKEYIASKKLFDNEISKKDELIKHLKTQLEKLIEDNNNFIQILENNKTEFYEFNKTKAEFENIIKEKDKKIDTLNSVISLKNEERLSFDSKKEEILSNLESKLNECNSNLEKKENEVKHVNNDYINLQNEKKFQEKKIENLEKEIETSRKNLLNKEKMIQRFNEKLDELEKKYKSNLIKLDLFEKNDNLNNLNFSEEKKKLYSKIQELELTRNSLLDKNSILEFMNKNLETEIKEKEKHYEDTLRGLNEQMSSNKNNEKIINDQLQEINKYKTSSDNNERKIKEYSKEIANLRINNNTLTNEIENYKQEINALKEAFEINITETAKLNKKTNEEKILTYEKQIKEYAEQFEKEKKKIKEDYNTHYGNLLREKAEISEALNTLKEEYTNYKSSNDKLNKTKDGKIVELIRLNKMMNNDISSLTSKTDLENRQLEINITEFKTQLNQSEKIKGIIFESERQLKNLNSVFVIQEEVIKSLTKENEKIKIELENKEKNNVAYVLTSTNVNNKELESLHQRISELEKINFQNQYKLQEKIATIKNCEDTNAELMIKIKDLKDTMYQNEQQIKEKNRIILNYEKSSADLSNTINDMSLTIKNLGDENANLKIKLESAVKIDSSNINNSVQINLVNELSLSKRLNEEKIFDLKKENKQLLQENSKLREDYELAKQQLERIVDEINENNILRIGPSITLRDEINNTQQQINITNLNNSSHLNMSNSIFDLADHNMNLNNNLNNNFNLISKDRDRDSNEYKIKIMDYEDKLEKLIISNSELQNKINSQNLEIKTLQDKVYSLENFNKEDSEINKKLKLNNLNNNSLNRQDSMSLPFKELKNLKLENERLQELNKDYEISISQLQDKLEHQYNEIHKIREEYEEEIEKLKKKEFENFSFNIQQKLNPNNEKNNIKRKNSFKSNEEKIIFLSSEIEEKNKFIEKLRSELCDTYALLGETNKKLEYFENDLMKFNNNSFANTNFNRDRSSFRDSQHSEILKELKSDSKNNVINFNYNAYASIDNEEYNKIKYLQDLVKSCEGDVERKNKIIK